MSSTPLTREYVDEMGKVLRDFIQMSEDHGALHPVHYKRARIAADIVIAAVDPEAFDL